MIYTEHEPLTAEEEAIRRSESEGSPGLEGLYRTAYDLVRVQSRRNLFYIADVFNSTKAMVYLDWAHVVIEGNHLIARRIFETLRRCSP